MPLLDSLEGVEGREEEKIFVCWMDSIIDNGNDFFPPL